MVKNPPANEGDVRDMGSIPGMGRSPGGGNVNPLRCSCLGNPMDRRSWWATVHRVTEKLTRLKWLSTRFIVLPHQGYTDMTLCSPVARSPEGSFQDQWFVWGRWEWSVVSRVQPGQVCYSPSSPISGCSLAPTDAGSFCEWLASLSPGLTIAGFP